jgi:hypothetical protein
MMFVVPDSVRPESLFIDEVSPLFDLGDLGEPGQFDPRKRANSVLNELPSVHDLWKFVR